ncbi:hypothetical protein TNIN_136321 [Trichonephila inaurata madagascariensis]|uniref:Uncharacterized protein n=1 Tax=Trichonephila inaurata madagascariensis TaxID=2747483 RepID=A0A8X6I398_9ARAC|nr:hypothetical protein TNIN_136321 [Trichonephila inaurata madagascariensis]
MSHAHPRPRPEALVCRLKHQRAEQSVKRTSDEQKVKRYFLLVSFPAKWGPMRGLEGRIRCAEALVQHFPDVRGQVEDIILGNREAQTSPSDHLTQPENRSDS